MQLDINDRGIVIGVKPLDILAEFENSEDLSFISDYITRTLPSVAKIYDFDIFAGGGPVVAYNLYTSTYAFVHEHKGILVKYTPDIPRVSVSIFRYERNVDADPNYIPEQYRKVMSRSKDITAEGQFATIKNIYYACEKRSVELRIANMASERDVAVKLLSA